MAFDLSTLPDEAKRAGYVSLARLLDLADRHDDMASVMRELVLWTDSQGSDLQIEERTLLSVAYKNVIGSRRASWRTIVDPANRDASFPGLVNMVRAKLEQEIDATCAELLDLLENKLILHADAHQAGPEAKIFYMKMVP